MKKRFFQDSFIPKIIILPFLSQKFTHDWQVNSICCKSSLYEQAKEFNDFRFYYFPFKPENTHKIYVFLNHFSIYMQVNDLYFMVQWFCLISWRLWWTNIIIGILDPCDTNIFHIKCVWVSDLHFMVQWVCHILKTIWWIHIVLVILIQCDTNIELELYM